MANIWKIFFDIYPLRHFIPYCTYSNLFSGFVRTWHSTPMIFRTPVHLNGSVPTSKFVACKTPGSKIYKKYKIPFRWQHRNIGLLTSSIVKYAAPMEIAILVLPRCKVNLRRLWAYGTAMTKSFSHHPTWTDVEVRAIFFVSHSLQPHYCKVLDKYDCGRLACLKLK